MTKRINHMSHGLGEHVTGHAVKGNIARDGAPKLVQPVMVHDGMTKQTEGGATALGGDHASAVDALTGNVVVPGARNVSQAGWGNGGIQNGHPLAKAPGSKNLKPVPPSFGMKDDGTMHALGEAMLSEAFAASAGDDRMAHGRDAKGRK
jgi:hypothetical protein